MELKYDIKIKLIIHFLCVREIFIAYLYSLALVHFNDVEVKAVDSFPGTKKDGFQCEIVAYVDKNLQKCISEVSGLIQHTITMKHPIQTVQLFVL